MAWDRTKVGPRLGNPSNGYENLGDPAKGAAVPRCRVCGMPATPEVKLLTGSWTLGGFTMRLTLCEREIAVLDPRATDPLEHKEPVAKLILAGRPLPP